MLMDKERNKSTMTYWLYLSKYEDGKLTEDEQILAGLKANGKAIDLLQSTSADLLDVATPLAKFTGGILRSTAKKIELPQVFVAGGYRLPNIGRMGSVDSRDNHDNSRFKVNRTMRDPQFSPINCLVEKIKGL